MPGNREGGLKAVQTQKNQLGEEEFHRRVIERGSKGGKNSSNSAWALGEGNEQMRINGRKGVEARRLKKAMRDE